MDEGVFMTIISVLLFSLIFADNHRKTIIAIIAAMFGGALIYRGFVLGVGVLSSVDSVFDTLTDPFAILFLGFCFWGLWHLGSLISKLIIKVPTDYSEYPIFRHIVAPICVSLVIYYLTGSPTFTFISVPILGFITASIGI